MAYKYLLRPSDRSKMLMIEFVDNCSGSQFINTLNKLLKSGGCTLTRSQSVANVWDYEHDHVLGICSHGKFKLTVSQQGSHCITSDWNQRAINFLDDLLTKSPDFEKQEVDFKDYRMTVTGKLKALVRIFMI